MTLIEQIESEARPFGIAVEYNGKEVVLNAPDGMCFEPELHALVNAQWDADPMPVVLRAALRDVRAYGPRLSKCPDTCPCNE